MSDLANEFKTDYKIQMPLSGVAMSSFERNGTKFAYLDYDVKKGLKWNMKFYWDKEKAKPFFDVDETKNAWLSDSGYEIKDAASGQVLGAWVPKKRLLRWFLRQTYTFIVNGKVVARSPGDSCFKIFIPSSIRAWFARKVVTADGKPIAKIRCMSTLGCGTVSVKALGGTIEDEKLAKVTAVLAAICGLQD